MSRREVSAITEEREELSNKLKKKELEAQTLLQNAMTAKEENIGLDALLKRSQEDAVKFKDLNDDLTLKLRDLAKLQFEVRFNSPCRLRPTLPELCRWDFFAGVQRSVLYGSIVSASLVLAFSFILESE